MKFLKNKFLIAVATAAVIIIMVPAVLSAMGYTPLVRNIFNTVSTPLRYVTSCVSGGFTGFFDYFARYDELLHENEELRRKNAELLAERADVYREENEWLRKYLGVAEVAAKFDMLDASVVGRENGTVTLNRGSWHGVKKYMTVITENGVVGTVDEVGYNWCKVLILTDPASSVGAIDTRCGISGVASGKYDLVADGYILMEYLSSENETDDGTNSPGTSGGENETAASGAAPEGIVTDGENENENASDENMIKVGDMIYTSGSENGSLCPGGLVIGCVESVELNPYSREMTAKIRVSADMTDIRRVMIIIGFEESLTDE